MKAKEIIKFWIYDGSTWVDYTDGTLKIDIVRGCQSYEGPFTQPDVGQLRVLSRNEQLDPYLNELVRFGERVKVTADLVTIYTGIIDGIDVNYKPRGQDPEIVLNCIDMIGTMQKHILSDDFIKTRPQNWTTDSLLQDLNLYENVPGYGVPGFNCPVRLATGNNYVKGGINSGTTAWAALSSRAATDLGFVYANVDNDIYYYELPYDNANHPNNSRPTHIYFEYDGSGTNYLDIQLNDGFENIINKLSFSNSWGIWNYPGLNTFTTSSYSASFENQDSVTLWGPSAKTVNFLSNEDYVTEQKNKIFEEMSYPQRDISEITWDATKNSSAARSVDILDNININHVLSDEISINRKYSVIGIRHDITESDWRITYILRNWNYIETAMGPVTVVATPSTGDTNTDYSFSVDTEETIVSYLWDLDEGQTSTLANPINIDYNLAGTKEITVTVTNIYGWTKTSPIKELVVLGAAPTTPTVTYTVSDIGVYTFIASGEGGLTWNWNFGDSTGGTGQTTTHNYTNPGTYNVSVAVQNSYGTVYGYTTVEVPVGGPVPIRYIKFVWDYIPKATNTLIPSTIKQLRVYTGTFGQPSYVNRLLNKPIINLKTYQGKVNTTNTLGGKEYDSTTDTLFLTDNSNTNNAFYLFSQTGFSGDLSTEYLYLEVDYDLGTTYTNLAGVQAILDLATPGSGQSYGAIKVYASQDNINWFLFGNITPSSINGGYGTNVTSNMVAVKTLPYTFPASYITFTTYPTIPMRYIKANIKRGANTGQVYVSGLYAYNGRDQYWDVTTDGSINSFSPYVEGVYAYSVVRSGICVKDIDSTNWSGGYELSRTTYNDILPEAGDIIKLSGTSTIPIDIDLIYDLGKVRENIWTVGILHGNAGTPPNSATVDWYSSIDGINWTTIKLNNQLSQRTTGSFPYWDSDFVTNSPRGFFVTPLTTIEQETPF